jgi:signal transduction histidine kinase
MNEVMPLLVEKDGELQIAQSTIDRICEIEKQKKALDKEYKQFKSALLDAMEEHGIKQFTSEDDSLKITYVEPTERISIDTDKLWSEHQNVAFECQKFTPVKASVRITVR